MKVRKWLCIHAFKICDTTTEEGGLENHLAHFEQINYVMPQPEGEFHLELRTMKIPTAATLRMMRCSHLILMKIMNLHLKVIIL